MSVEQYLTLAIAIYGAVVSTILAFREIQKGRRRLLIRLDYVYVFEIVEITITNVGYRPVTITGLEVHPEEGGVVHAPSLFSTRIPPTQTLPVTLNDGEHITLPLSDVISATLRENGMKATLRVHDAEGRIYSKYKTGARNIKAGHFRST